MGCKLSKRLSIFSDSVFTVYILSLFGRSKRCILCISLWKHHTRWQPTTQTGTLFHPVVSFCFVFFYFAFFFRPERMFWYSMCFADFDVLVVILIVCIEEPFCTVYLWYRCVLDSLRIYIHHITTIAMWFVLVAQSLCTFQTDIHTYTV